METEMLKILAAFVTEFYEDPNNRLAFEAEKEKNRNAASKN